MLFSIKQLFPFLHNDPVLHNEQNMIPAWPGWAEGLNSHQGQPRKKKKKKKKVFALWIKVSWEWHTPKQILMHFNKTQLQMAQMSISSLVEQMTYYKQHAIVSAPQNQPSVSTLGPNYKQFFFFFLLRPSPGKYLLIFSFVRRKKKSFTACCKAVNAKVSTGLKVHGVIYHSTTACVKCWSWRTTWLK